MDEYLECRYKSLEETVLQIRKYIISKKLKTDDTKNKATILASWLMEKKTESTFLNLVEEKPAEGYQISILPV